MPVIALLDCSEQFAHLCINLWVVVSTDRHACLFS